MNCKTYFIARLPIRGGSFRSFKISYPKMEQSLCSFWSSESIEWNVAQIAAVRIRLVECGGEPAVQFEVSMVNTMEGLFFLVAGTEFATKVASLAYARDIRSEDDKVVKCE